MGQEELQKMNDLYNMITAYLVNYSFQIFGAIVVMILGVFIGRRLGNLVLVLCEKKSLDITLSRFFASCARIAIRRWRYYLSGRCIWCGQRSASCLYLA